MIRVQFRTEVYQTSDWFKAWLTKNGQSKRVMVGLPYHTWKNTFKEYCASRGFMVTFS